MLLVGFSGGAAFAGGLVLDDPARFPGAAVLYGTLPFDAGVPVGPARLAGVSVLVQQGEDDHVIPRELLDRTWDYVRGESGADAVAAEVSGRARPDRAGTGRPGGLARRPASCGSGHSTPALTTLTVTVSQSE